MTNIDEIYINKRGYGGGLGAQNGVIRVYTKKGYSGKDVAGAKVNSLPYVVLKGFQKYEPFENPPYLNLTDKGFLNYGTIGWIPKIATDEAGNFRLAIPNLNAKKVKLMIEGISSDGQMISDVVSLDLP